MQLIRAEKLHNTLPHYNSFMTTFLGMLALKFQRDLCIQIVFNYQKSREC